MFLALCLGWPSLTASQEAIALDGDIAPGTGGGTYLFFYGASINDSSDVVFIAAVAGDPARIGIFLESNAGGGAVVLDGEPSSGTNGGVFRGFLTAKSNDFGQVVFLARIAGGTALRGIFLSSAGSHIPIALSADPAPGTGGGVFADFFWTPSLNDSGAVVFNAAISGGDAASGIFSYVDGAVSAIALEGEPAPGIPGFVFDTFGGPVLNAGGEVAFAAIVHSESALRYVIYIHSSGSTSVAAISGEAPIGGGGAVYDSFPFDGLAFTAPGDVYFDAGLKSSEPRSPTGIFVDSVLSPGEALVLEGSIAPGTTGGTFLPQTSSPSANDSGAVAFRASVTGGSSRSGVFMSSQSSTSTIAVEGGLAPETAGGVYDGFREPPSINASGSVAFTADVRNGSATEGSFWYRSRARALALS